MRRRMLGLYLLLILPVPLSAQATATISGRVLTSGGSPLAGATVLVDDSVAAVTAADGSYRLAGLAPGARRLSVDVPGEGEAQANVTLAPDGVTRCELRLAPRRVPLAGDVGLGYGRVSRRDLAVSVATADRVELGDAPAGNVMEALQGLLPGVDVLPRSTAPGAPVDLRIRGVRALDNVDDPLYVVDGMPASRVDNLSAASIESIEVLKDAAATAVYGSSAANGVVLITTRRGGEGPLRLSVDGSVGTQGNLGLARLMNGSEFAEYRREAARAQGTYTTDAALFTPQELQGIAQGTSTDWQRLITRSGAARRASLSGGGQVAGARLGVSGSYFDQTGVTLGQGYHQGELAANVERTFGRLQLAAGVVGSQSTWDAGADSLLWWSATGANPLGVARDASGAPVDYPGGDGWLINPLLYVNDFTNAVTDHRLIARGSSDLRLGRGVTWRVIYGLDRRSSRGDLLARADVSRGNADYRKRASEQARSSTLETTLTLQRNFSRAQRLDLLVGMGRRPWRDSIRTDQGWGDSLGAGWATMTSVRTQHWLFARAGYSLRDRYLLTVTGRRDSYDEIPVHRAFGTGAIGLAWQLGEEPFLRRLGAFSRLKLRASFGRSSFPWTVDPADLAGPIPPPTGYVYTPEHLDQLDFGLDLGTIGNRVTATMDVYRRDSRDQTTVFFNSSAGMLVPVPGSATRNTGLEVALTTVNLRGWHGLGWTSDLALSHNRNRILRLSGGFNPTWAVGQPINDLSDPQQRAFYGYRVIGIWRLGEETAAAAAGAQPGMIHIQDINGDGTITMEDRVFLGDTYPQWSASLGNRVAYRGLELSVLLAARLGYTIREPLTSNYHGSLYNNLQQDYWTPANPSNTVPRPGTAFFMPEPYATTLDLRSGSHWRVRQVTLRWTVPPALLGGRSGGSLYIAARNPWISGHFVGYDPEYPGLGAPAYRTVYIGASAGL